MDNRIVVVYPTSIRTPLLGWRKVRLGNVEVWASMIGQNSKTKRSAYKVQGTSRSLTSRTFRLQQQALRRQSLTSYVPVSGIINRCGIILCANTHYKAGELTLAPATALKYQDT